MDYPVVATKEGVFAYMQQLMENEERYRGLSPWVRRNFVLLRTHAEGLARFHYVDSKGEALTLSRIYDALQMTGELAAEEALKLREWEEKLSEEFGCLQEAREETEHALEELPWLEGLEEDFSAQMLAGAARRAVMEGQLRGAAKIGALYGGAILMPYVEWILQRSLTLGLRRLYFIARDGYILKLMADSLIEKLHLAIETRYIHGSRRAWRMPSYLGEDGELRGLVGWSYTQHVHTVEDLAEVLQMPVAELYPYLAPDYQAPGSLLDGGGLAASTFLLDKNPAFRRLLKEIMAERRALAVDYLKQEIDISDDNFAFVELGGGGFTQICLSKLLQDFYSGSVRTFFYKMDRVRINDDRCVFYNFFPSKLKHYLVVEMVCRAPEGQTEGYERVDGRVRPIKKQGEKELYLQRGYGDYVKGIEAFVHAYGEARGKYSAEPSLRASFACMEALSAQEDSEITEFFGGLPNRVTGREQGAPDFAPPLTKKELQDIFVRYGDGENGAHYKGTDFAMSLKRSTPQVRALAEKYAQKGGEIRKRWLRMFPRLEGAENNSGGLFCYPFSLLGKRVVVYGAGIRGRNWYRSLTADKAVEVVQWLDKDYLRLKGILPVTGDLDSLGQVDFDWMVVDFANNRLVEEMLAELRSRGVPEEKIYYPDRISEWTADWRTYINV